MTRRHYRPKLGPGKIELCDWFVIAACLFLIGCVLYAYDEMGVLQRFLS